MEIEPVQPGLANFTWPAPSPMTYPNLKIITLPPAATDSREIGKGSLVDIRA